MIYWPIPLGQSSLLVSLNSIIKPGTHTTYPLSECVKPAVHYSQTWANMTNRGTKLFFRRIKYCWWKRDERVAVHCSMFAVNFSAADNFFSMKKFFVFVEETATPTQILRMAYGEKPVRETWRMPFIDYSPYVVFSSFCPYFAVVHE